MSAIGTRPYAQSRYHLTKWAAEQLVRQSGLDWTIIRPSLIYGYDERDRLLNLLRAALSWPLNFMQLYSFPLLNGGETLIQPVSVREVARCFALAPRKRPASARRTISSGDRVFLARNGLQNHGRLGKKGIYEEIPILLILRKLLWWATLLLPLFIIACLAMNTLSLTSAEIGMGVWSLLLLTAYRWRKTILYFVPGDPLILASEVLNGVAPREFRVSEMLKMAVEDNVGDPLPATTTFAYTPETFEQALAKIYR